MAHYFVRELSNDDKFSDIIPRGIELILNHLNKSKQATRLIRRYEQELAKFKVLADSDGVDILLTTKIDVHGEFMCESFVD